MNISESFKIVNKNIAEAAKNSGRNPSDITLIAVTKTFPSEVVSSVINAGAENIGENRVQEAEEKFAQVKEKAAWHLIGHLQKNKARKAVKFIDVFHSVDSIALAEEINKRALKKLDIFAQVNIGQEGQKSGIDPDDLFETLSQFRKLENLNCKGLMVIPPFDVSKEETRKFFRMTSELQNDLNSKNVFDYKMIDLSMGMTSDYEIAIEEGSTFVRVGRAITGERTIKKL